MQKRTRSSTQGEARSGLRSGPRSAAAERRAHVQVFAALADETRLTLLTRLSSGQPHSITQLTGGTRITRQAVTKHLRLLEHAQLVRCVRAGRESVFELNPEPLLELREYLSLVSQQWEDALARLKLFAEGTET